MKHGIFTYCVAGLIGLLVSGCGSTPPRLQVPQSGGGFGAHGTRANTPYSFDDLTLCLASPGTITVEAVEIANPSGGIHLRRFAILPARSNRPGGTINYVWDHHWTLRRAGFPDHGSMQVDGVCPSDKNSPADQADNGPAGKVGVYILGIEVDRPANAAASGTGFTVRYRSEGSLQEAFYPFALVICPEAECNHIDARPPSR